MRNGGIYIGKNRSPFWKRLVAGFILTVFMDTKLVYLMREIPYSEHIALWCFDVMLTNRAIVMTGDDNR